MRERLALFDGSLTTGSGASGGWTVRATLPTAGMAG
jgi:signal transduction histidine kinase